MSYIAKEIQDKLFRKPTPEYPKQFSQKNNQRKGDEQFQFDWKKKNKLDSQTNFFFSKLFLVRVALRNNCHMKILIFEGNFAFQIHLLLEHVYYLRSKVYNVLLDKFSLPKRVIFCNRGNSYQSRPLICVCEIVFSDVVSNLEITWKVIVFCLL